MAYEFLKKLFGEAKEGEDPKKMSYEELEAAIEADKDLKLANLATGDYVDKRKLDKKITELTDTKALLDAANAEIGKYKDMDIEGIKTASDNWKTKYETETAALNKKLLDQERNHSADKFLSNYKFSSDMARKAIMEEFMSKNLEMDDQGNFLGANDFMNGIKERDPGCFMAEEPAQNTPPAPSFAPNTPATPPSGKKKMTLMEKMKFANEHPGTDVNTLFE